MQLGRVSIPRNFWHVSAMRNGFVAGGDFCSKSKRNSSSHSGFSIVTNRWDEKAGLRRDAVRSQVIDVLEAQEIKETGNEEG